ncbi:conserved hypothetical protein [Leishmania braziliensis MHOM/BR/75/M2904]|uniref:Uncharacterized protein n=2 Tax=Leishmania braziliensis TaxID=5660 RepID=A4HFX1_LEIBR|nr:conserved hypothetical protein [Leishmania braziliensis MHOM/BR/75/M2904]CAJ2475412.1 unnamed protein product [Leishmania braziliensis]CAM45489.2 conserved hypothetical protein [Leishmania braziliensis MHOM/BR/75/M2904]SYZ67126.1 Intraflagellar_transport_protein_43 [Leishmania braziliensis MHOM/BR/75/M2904]
MTSTGNGGGNRTAGTLPSPLQTEISAPVTSVPDMHGTPKPFLLDSMHSADSSLSSQGALSAPNKTGGMLVSPSYSEVRGRTAAESSAPGPRASMNTDQHSKPSVNSMKASTAADGSDSPSKSRSGCGRRGQRRDNSNWFDAEKPANVYRPADTELNQNVQVVYDGIDDLEQIRHEQAERAQRQKEHLAQHIADLPTGYQATLPRLNELDATNSWDKLLRMMRSEYDLSCLTSCLARELDEDVTWNPEMLLVQLTSDMLDAAELQKDSGEAYVPVDASDIGQMTGGEASRKRNEKGLMTTAPMTSLPMPGGAAPAVGTTGGAARESEKKRHEKAAAASPPPSFQTTMSKTLGKHPTAAPAAAVLKSKNAGNGDNDGATVPTNSPSSCNRSAAASRPGEAGGDGGSNTNVSSAVVRREARRDKSNRNAAVKPQGAKLFPK